METWHGSLHSCKGLSGNTINNMVDSGLGEMGGGGGGVLTTTIKKNKKVLAYVIILVHNYIAP